MSALRRSLAYALAAGTVAYAVVAIGLLLLLVGLIDVVEGSKALPTTKGGSE